jgi:alpha-L-fucosidase
LAMGGNYLLNVGPKPDGTIAEENVKALEKIGTWYKSVREAFDGTIPASDMINKDEIKTAGSNVIVERDSALLTRKGNTIYVHLYRDPQCSSILLKPLDVIPRKATLLNNRQELEFSVDLMPCYWKEKPYLRIRNLPVNELTDSVMVIKLEFDESACD